MQLFEELKATLTMAFCTKCERSDCIQLSDATLWCSWCGQKCEVSYRHVDVITRQAFEALQINTTGNLVDQNNVPIQPLRVPRGWKVVMRNHLFEIDPTPETVANFYLFNQTMLVLSHDDKRRLLDIGWTDELNFDEGEYYVDLYEGDYKGAILQSYRTKDRIELVEKIETILEEVSNQGLLT